MLCNLVFTYANEFLLWFRQNKQRNRIITKICIDIDEHVVKRLLIIDFKTVLIDFVFLIYSTLNTKIINMI